MDNIDNVQNNSGIDDEISRKKEARTFTPLFGMSRALKQISSEKT